MVPSHHLSAISSSLLPLYVFIVGVCCFRVLLCGIIRISILWCLARTKERTTDGISKVVPNLVLDTWLSVRGRNIRCISEKHHKNSTVSSSGGEHFLFSCFSEDRTARREGDSEKENDEYLETTLTFNLSLIGGLEFK